MYSGVLFKSNIRRLVVNFKNPELGLDQILNIWREQTYFSEWMA